MTTPDCLGGSKHHQRSTTVYREIPPSIKMPGLGLGLETVPPK